MVNNKIILSIIGIVLIVGFTPSSALSDAPFSTGSTVNSAGFSGAASVYAADIDGDGDIDVIGAAQFDYKISWWENVDGAGNTWNENIVSASSGGAISVHAADINHDGAMDIIGAAFTDGTVVWWDNTNKDGTVWTPNTIATGFTGVTSVYGADIDGDGDTDIVGAAQNVSEVYCWTNENGSGTSWSSVYMGSSLSPCPKNVYVDDMDLDGDLDVINTSDGYTGSTWEEVVWYSNDYPSFTGSNYILDTTGDIGPSSVRTGDIDGDGDVDAVVSESSTGIVKWYENTNGFATAWSDHLISVDFGGAKFVNIGDVDNDGDLDVIGVADASAEVTWWENTDRLGTTWNTNKIDTSFIGNSVHNVDIDSDGDLDVLATTSSGTGEIVLYKNTMIHRNTEFEPITDFSNLLDPHVISSSAGQTRSVVAADMNHDGKMDVVSACYDQNTYVIHNPPVAATDTWTATTITNNAIGAVNVEVADINGDGLPDVVAAAYDIDSITVYIQQPSPTPAIPYGITDSGTYPSAADGVRDVHVVDLNNDGYPDILAASVLNNKVAAWIQSPTMYMTFTEQVLTTTANAPTSVDAADMDNDGDIDVVFGSADRVSWFENDGGCCPDIFIRRYNCKHNKCN